MITNSRSAIQDAVYETVCYADVFDTPIDLDRLHRYLIGIPLTLTEIAMATDDLVAQQRLGRHGDVVFLATRDEVADGYDAGTRRAAALWTHAERWAKRIGRIPLVRMVAVMGRLASGCVAESDGIELFVVVRPRRLWLTRLLITKVIDRAARSGIDIDIIIVVTTRSMEMHERSLHLACELAQMAVVVGNPVCKTLRRSNQWIFNYLPNATIEGDLSHLSPLEPSPGQKRAEWFLLLPPFRLIENWVRTRTIEALKQPAKTTTSGPQPAPVTPPSFSTEVCNALMTQRAARFDTAWQQRISAG